MALPPLANNLIALLKDSSLAYAIGVVELSMVGSRIQAESFQPVPVFMTVAVVYLVLTSTLSQFAGALERKLAVGQRHSNAYTAKSLFPSNTFASRGGAISLR